jgi:hypothetical protein
VKRRYLVLVLAIALLGVLNAWHWAPAGGPARERTAAGPGGVRAEDLRLRVGLATGEPSRSTRDLFRMRLPPPPPAPPPEPVAVKVIEPPPGPPPKTPEQLAEEAARAELGQLRLVGVVFRGEKGQAFLVKGDQLYMVQTGGRVGDRFQVESIAPESIQLKDPATRVTGSIPVSGKK